MKISLEELRDIIKQEVAAAMEEMVGHHDMGMTDDDYDDRDEEMMHDDESFDDEDEALEDEEDDLDANEDESDDLEDSDEEEDEGLDEAKKSGAVKKRKFHGKTYRASAGSLAAMKKHPEDIKQFSWADQPWAAKQAATIVKTGHPIKKKKAKHTR